MNRTFLLFLMIGTALLILVIGGNPTEDQPAYTPWNINILDNNKIRVFGVTLGKTTIQDANQIFASFPETRLIDNNGKLQLLAIYQQLQFGGLIADIELNYDLDDSTLQKLKDSAIIAPKSEHLNLPENVEISLLNTAIANLIYKPSIDYEIDIILQRFGTPESEQKISENSTLWTYTESGLEIIINDTGPDTFIYSLLEAKH